MHCIRAFPESLQCPKEAQFLFGRAADVAGLAEAIGRLPTPGGDTPASRKGLSFQRQVAR